MIQPILPQDLQTSTAAEALPTGEAVTKWRGLSPAMLVAGVIVVGTLFRLWAAWAVGLGYGESYHFSCAIHPAAGYFDHPPLGVLLGTTSMTLLHSTHAFALRLPFVLLFVGTTLLTYVLGRRFYGPWQGAMAALLINLSAVFSLSTATFLQSDGPLMFFWLACFYCISKIVYEEKVERPYLWWTLTGVTLGLTLLSKYHAVFLVAGTFLFVITQRDQRRWLFHPGPYLALAIAAAMFAPVLWWNAQHDWISFLWQSQRGTDFKGLRWDWFFRNIGGQALWLLPWIWLPLVIELGRAMWQGPKNRLSWFITCTAAPPILFFTAISIYAPIGFHFHWQAPGYILLFLPLGNTVYQGLIANKLSTKRWLVGSMAFTCVALLFVTTHASSGWWRALGPQWLSNHFGEADDPTLECLDWNSLEGEFQKRGWLGKDNLFVVTNRWFQGGKADYALRGQMPVVCFNGGDPRSFAFFDSPKRWVGQDAILVFTKKFMPDVNGEYGKYFEKIEPAGTVDVYRGGFKEETLYLYTATNLKQPFPVPYYDVAKAK